jgi:hypothetical protein
MAFSLLRQTLELKVLMEKLEEFSNKILNISFLHKSNIGIGAVGAFDGKTPNSFDPTAGSMSAGGPKFKGIEPISMGIEKRRFFEQQPLVTPSTTNW